VGVTLPIPLINNEWYKVKHTTFNDNSEITYVRRSGVASKWIMEGLIPNSSCKTRQVFTITNTSMRDLLCQEESSMKCVNVYTNGRTVEGYRVYWFASRLDMLHKGRFKGSLPILCKIPTLNLSIMISEMSMIISIHVGDCWKINININFKLNGN